MSVYTVRVLERKKKKLKLERRTDSGDELENVASHVAYEQIHVAYCTLWFIHNKVNKSVLNIWLVKGN